MPGPREAGVHQQRVIHQVGHGVVEAAAEAAQQARGDVVDPDARDSPHGPGHLGAERVRREFTGMVERCADCGFDLAGGLVEVVPTAHYMMGGVEFAADCTTTLRGLFVAGEDSGGVHGANRLGGNGVANSTVFGAVAGDHMAAWVREQGAFASPDVKVLEAAIAECERPLSAAERTPGGRKTMALPLRKVANAARPTMKTGPGGHILTGPIYVEGADSGDVLEVRFKSIKPAINYACNSFGPRGGFLREDFPNTGALETSAYTSIRANGEVLMKPVAFTRVQPGQSLLKHAA